MRQSNISMNQRGKDYDRFYSVFSGEEACQEKTRSNPVALEEGTAGRDQEKKRSMSMYDFTVKDNVITVGDSYFGKATLNEYFQNHKLKAEYPMEQIDNLIDAVAFVLDGKGGAGDHLTIELMVS